MLKKNEPQKTPALRLAAPHHLDDHDASGNFNLQPRPRTTMKNDALALSSPSANAPTSPPRLDDGSSPSGSTTRRRTTLRGKLSKAGVLVLPRDDSDSTHPSQKRKSDPKRMSGKMKEGSSREQHRISTGSSSSMKMMTTATGAFAIPGINASPSNTSMGQQHPERIDTFLLPTATPIDDEEQLLGAKSRTTEDIVNRMGEKIKQELQAQLAAQHPAPYTTAEVGGQETTTRTSHQESTISFHHPRDTQQEQQNQSNGPLTSSKSAYSFQMISIIVVLLMLAGIVTGVVLSLKDKDDNTMVLDSSSSSSTSAPIAQSQQAQEWLEILRPWIAPSEDDQLAFQDATSPQSLALEWLSTDTISRDLNPSSQQQIILERYVLAVLYFATKGSQWNLREGMSYLHETSPSCHWNNHVAWEEANVEALGVYCTGENATVTRLALHRVGLYGSLPWELSLLSDLVTWQFNNNALRGTLPTTLDTLSKLESLVLSSNSLTGRLPDRLPSSIRTMDLSTNAISGKIPSSIFGSQLLKIANLHLENNNFSGQLPSELGHAVTMTLFAIDHNALMGTIPTELGLLTNLSTLWLDANDLTGTIPMEFAQLSKLESFTFEKNLLTGSANDALCSSNRLWTTLKGDCLLDEDGQVEIACSCCTECCNDANSFCQ